MGFNSQQLSRGRGALVSPSAPPRFSGAGVPNDASGNLPWLNEGQVRGEPIVALLDPTNCAAATVRYSLQQIRLVAEIKNCTGRCAAGIKNFRT